MKRQTKWIGYVVIGAFLVGLVLAGCASNQDTEQGATTAVQASIALAQEPTEGLIEPTKVSPPSEISGSDPVLEIDEGGQTDADYDGLSQTVKPLSAGALSASEADGILYMREEEKLARDVYLTLHERWGLEIFQNIARSEQTHMDAVQALIAYYELDDPAAGKGVGEFENTALQGLYDDLVEQGGRSLLQALEVGAAIEEIDIIDLQEYIAQTDKVDIQRVYENLLRGSENHLRYFVRLYEREGQAYQPQYLSQAAFVEIVNGSMDAGGAAKGTGRRGGRP